jgi:hypothetical protein
MNNTNRILFWSILNILIPFTHWQLTSYGISSCEYCCGPFTIYIQWIAAYCDPFTLLLYLYLQFAFSNVSVSIVSRFQMFDWLPMETITITCKIRKPITICVKRTKIADHTSLVASWARDASDTSIKNRGLKSISKSNLNINKNRWKFSI